MQDGIVKPNYNVSWKRYVLVTSVIRYTLQCDMMANDNMHKKRRKLVG